jgi:hypothetical protein
MIMRAGAERTVAVGDAVPPRGMMAGRGGLPPPAVPKGMNRIVLELQKLTPEQFALFEQFIYRQTGIRMREGKITLLSNRIRRRLRDLGLESFEEYYRLLVAKRRRGGMTGRCVSGRRPAARGKRPIRWRSACTRRGSGSPAGVFPCSAPTSARR